MNGAGEARVKGPNHSQRLDRIFRIRNRSSNQSLLHWTQLVFVVSGAGIPGSRNNALTVIDLLVFNGDPVAQSTTRTFSQTHARSLFWYFKLCMYRLAWLQLHHPFSTSICHHFCLQSSGCMPSHYREERGNRQ